MHEGTTPGPTTHGPGCPHSNLACLNPYEFVRKYRCEACGGVMMCACDEAFGRRFLNHQIEYGVELDTQQRRPVTHGFLAGVCNACRGEPAVAAPLSAIPGRTSKVKRFYWRELFFAETERFADWSDAHPSATPEEIEVARKRIAREALDEIKTLNEQTPKYDTREVSQEEVITRYSVEVEAMRADYAPKPEKGAAILWEGDAISPERFATRRYEAAGWSVMPLESAPLHALFGVLMWLLIQDIRDPKSQLRGFGSRTAYEGGEDSVQIWTDLPEDFGTSGYARRRARAIEAHLEFLQPDGMPDRGTLLDLFDYWRAHSRDLREYLWAHRDDDVDRARRLIEILPAAKIIAVLRYLVGDYWNRFVGWPDLLLWRGDAILLVEVKSSSDRLSAEQMRWIADNHSVLGFPFRIAKLHRSSPKPRTGTVAR